MILNNNIIQNVTDDSSKTFSSENN